MEIRKDEKKKKPTKRRRTARLSMDESLDKVADAVHKLKELYDAPLEHKFLKLDKQEKVSLLSLKNSTMLSYLTGLLSIINDKVTLDDPSAQKGRYKTIESRVVLERGVKPLEKKLQYQLDKLIRAYRRMEKEYDEAEKRALERTREVDNTDDSGSDSDSDSEDETMAYRPNAIKSAADKSESGKKQTENIDDDNDDEEDDDNKKSDDVYRPPKINAALPPVQQSHFEDKFIVKDHKNRSNRSRMQAMDEYLKDQNEQPDWESSIGANIIDHGKGGIKSMRDNEREKRVTQYEEDNFTRLNNMGKSKLDRKKLKQRERMNRVNIIGGEDFSIFNSKRKMEDSTSRRPHKKTKSVWDRAKRRL